MRSKNCYFCAKMYSAVLFTKYLNPLKTLITEKSKESENNGKVKQEHLKKD